MTIEGEKIRQPKKEKELPSVEKKDEWETLADREEKFVEEWGMMYKIKLLAEKEIAETNAPMLKNLLRFIESEKVRGASRLIEETAIRNIGRGGS